MRRTKKDAEKTRADILDAAEQLFAVKGVQATSLDQIARSAGVTRGAVYWHFRDKSDLLQALRDRYRPPEMDIMEAALACRLEDVLDVIARVTRSCLETFAAETSRQRMYLILSQNAADTGNGSDLEGTGLIERLMIRAREDGQLAADLCPRAAALSLSAMFHGLMTQWMVSGRDFDLPGIGTRLIERQLRSLRIAETG